MFLQQLYFLVYPLTWQIYIYIAVPAQNGHKGHLCNKLLLKTFVKFYFIFYFPPPPLPTNNSSIQLVLVLVSNLDLVISERAKKYDWWDYTDFWWYKHHGYLPPQHHQHWSSDGYGSWWCCSIHPPIPGHSENTQHRGVLAVCLPQPPDCSHPPYHVLVSLPV